MLGMQGSIQEHSGMVAFMTSVKFISRIYSSEAGVLRVFFQSVDSPDFDCVVNCAGLGAQVIARLTDGHPSCRIP